jgi:hypothetical protein
LLAAAAAATKADKTMAMERMVEKVKIFDYVRRSAVN